MGDRTYVSLYLPTELVGKAMPIIEEGAGLPCDEGDRPDQVTFLGFEECNYGELNCEETLIEAGIPYTKRWEAGCEYTAGREHVRFTPEGELIRFEVYDEDRGVPLYEIEKALERNEGTDPIPEALDALGRVERLVACRKAKTFPLPWDNQAEYGRRYLERNT